jgi:hypothetical protein
VSVRFLSRVSRALAAIVALGCTSGPSPKAGPGAACCGGKKDGALTDAEAHLNAITSGQTDFKNPFEGDLTPVRRGEYLVRHVAACMECHTPRVTALKFDESKLLSGVENLMDLVPDDPKFGMVHSANLTPDPDTGLGKWTDDEIKHAFMDGIAKDGTVLYPVMPYSVFHNMTQEDADDIVLFLRSIPPVVHAAPRHQPLPGVAYLDPTAPVPVDAFPDTTLPADDPNYASAEHGKYLATSVSPCMFCHTEAMPLGDAHAIRIDKLFQGRRPWIPSALGEPIPAGVGNILSKNLTPTENGIKGWAPSDVMAAIKWGRDAEGKDLCSPMPYGPEGSFGLMLDGDATDIGRYLTTLEPKDNGTIGECCNTCHNADAGLLRKRDAAVMP